MVSKGVSAPDKAKVKRWVPIKEVISGQEVQVVQEASPHLDAKKVQGPTINESIEEQRFDPMQMESIACQWMVVK
ncbi:hypothetical protein OIU85_022512 [Salix viminalis]|uniref:Uncharacterized protein n=1 Tax=Salix viminalis TaxID=40686 RepID=A0A9Q0U704_SALVM|nr:hypothetical protein OIU85_022512 [Salix viminalis]